MKFNEGTPGNRYSPEERDRIKYLLEIAGRDLGSPSLVGYHGGGLTTLKLIIQTGRLAGRPSAHGGLAHLGIGNKGDLHFYPRFEGFPLDFDTSHLTDQAIANIPDEDAVSWASTYANTASERDIFMELTGLDITNDSHDALASEFFL